MSEECQVINKKNKDVFDTYSVPDAVLAMGTVR